MEQNEEESGVGHQTGFCERLWLLSHHGDKVAGSPGEKCRPF